MIETNEEKKAKASKTASNKAKSSKKATTQSKKTTNSKKAPSTKAKNTNNAGTKRTKTSKLPPQITKEKSTVLETYVINQETEENKTPIFKQEDNKNLNEVVNKLEEENIVLEDKVIKRSKLNKYIELILITLIIIVVILTTGYVIKEQSKINRNNMTLKSDIYSKVIENTKDRDNTKTEQTEEESAEIDYSNIQTISLTEFESKIINKENMTILVSKSTCYYCINYEPIINEVLNEQDKRIYRINILNLSNDDIEIFRSYYKFDKVPTLFTIKDGIVTSDLVGTKNKDELSKWTNENLE